MQFELTGLKFHRANDTLFGYSSIKKDTRTKKHLSFSEKAKTLATLD